MPTVSWQTQHVATHVYRFDRVSSTQDEARRLIEQGQAHGALLVAAEQTHGRGRSTHTWHSPRGNLYLSFVLRPDLPPSAWSQVTMITALALQAAIVSTVQLLVQLKWPNDALVRNRKVAGILAEIVDAYLMVGVGVNVNADLSDALSQATTLRAEIGRPLDVAILLRRFVEQLDEYYGQLLQGERFTRAWSAQLVTLGRVVRVRMGAQVVEGVAEQVDDSGALLVREASGAITVCHAGEVTLVP